MIREEVHAGFWWGKPRERDHFKDLYVCEKITLKRTIKKQGMMHASGLREGQEVGSREHIR